MFKRAYVRGIQNALVQGGHAMFPDEVTAAKVADYVADHVEFDPTSTQVPRETTAKIAEHILEASEQFKKQDGFKAASFDKVASLEDLSKLAHVHALDLMQKAAEGSNIEGGDKGNTAPSSAEAKMDVKARPGGYAEDSRGHTAVDTRPGAVGKEEEQPNKPAVSPPGSNSVVEQARTASLADLIRKTAAGTGSTIMGGDKGNTAPSSAEAKMDVHQRPQGYASLPGQGDLGQLMTQVRGPAVVGREAPHPNAPSEHPAGSNSVIEHSGKAAAEDPYLTLFKKTAAQVAPHLPGTLSDEQKIAHVRACMGMTDNEKARYLVGLEKEAADKTTAALPPGSRGDSYQQHTPEATHSRPGAYDGRTANQGTKQAESGTLPPFMMDKKDEKKDEKAEDKSEDKKDEKKDEKEASLADHFRRISAAVQTPANA